MNDENGVREKKNGLDRTWQRLRQLIIPAHIGKHQARVRLQMIAMIAITLGFVLLSLYVFHLS